MATTETEIQPAKTPQAQQKAPLQLTAIRTGYRVLGTMAPTIAGRIATNHFLGTRAGGKAPEDVVPLGARRLPIGDGSSSVKHAYMWGTGGPTVLLVHGWGADSRTMYSMTRPLLQRGFRVVAFDAPAHGVSPGNRTTMTNFKNAVGTVMDTLGEVHAVVGHSLGCIASISAVALREGDRLPKRMVLLSAPVSLPDVVRTWSKWLHIGPHVVELMRVELKQRNGVPVDHWNVVDRGGELEIPILVMHDRIDPIVPFRDAEKIVSGLRNARLHATSGLGHYRILSDQGAVSDVVDYLAEGTEMAVGEQSLQAARA